jgi:hypothetical protein
MQRRAAWLVALTLAGLLALLLVGVVLLPRLLYPPLSRTELQDVPTAKERLELQQAQSELQNNARTPLLQGLGGLLLVAGVIATWQQVLISREGQITERFTRAIDQLGSDKLDIRLGGIFALERIAKNSKADRSTITEVLCAFVRTHAPWPAGLPKHPEHHSAAAVDEHLPLLRDRAADVESILSVLGRDSLGQDDARPLLALVDLRHADLPHGAQLSRALLVYANLSYSFMSEVHFEEADLRGANLRRTNLKGGFLSRANLADAYLEGANLRGAHLAQANLVGAQLQQTDLRDANLSQADLRQASLRNADLRGADLRNARLEDTDLAEACADATTVWPEGFTAERRRSRGVIVETQAAPDVSPETGIT